MRKGRTLGAAFGLLTLLVSTFSGFVHEDETLHTICPEHGELVHVKQSAQSREENTRRWASGSANAEHEHCPLAWALRDKLAPETPRALESVAAAHADTPRLSSAVPGRDPLRYAPKSSPPPQA